MADKNYNAKLSKEEKENRDFIDIAFEPHKGQWMRTADRLLEAFKGRYHKEMSKKSRFVHNTIYELVSLFLPHVIFQSPYIRTQAKPSRHLRKEGNTVKDFNNYTQSRKMAGLINHDFKKIMAIYEQRKSVQDSLFFGFGITKTGYSYETISHDDQEFVLKNSPFIQRVNPKDFGWHPMATSTKDSIKLAHRLYMPKERMKKYDFLNSQKIKDVDSELPDHIKKKLNRSEKSKSKITDFCSLFEVHDQERGKKFYYGGENKIFLGKRDFEYDFNGSDFSQIKFSGDNDCFEGIPILEMIEDEAEALNDILTLIVEHLRKFAGQVFVEEGSIDADQLEALRNSEQGNIHLLRDLSNGKIQFQSPLQMGAEYFNVIQIYFNLIDRTLGIPDFRRMSGSNRKSATEASFIQGDATIRRNYFLSQVKDFVLSDVEKLAALKMQFSEKEESVYVLGELGYEEIEYTKEEIQGEYLFDFDVDNMGAANQADVNNMINSLQVMGQSPALQPMLATLDPYKLTKHLFKAMNMNFDSFRTDEPENQVHVTPERENELARKGDPMPQPKKGEAYVTHIISHIDDLKENGPSNVIIEHLSDTLILAQKDGKSKEVKDAMAEAGYPDLAEVLLQPSGQQPQQQPQQQPMMQPGTQQEALQERQRAMAPNQRV